MPAIIRPIVQLHLRYGMILFIASEVMFFVAWFWAYFNAALFPSPVESIGGTWPPKGMKVPRSVRLPAAQHPDPALLRHHGDLGAPRADQRRSRGAEEGLVGDDRPRPDLLAVQAYEYAHAPFGFADNIYTSAFFMATGFHGFHVIVGTIFLVVCLIRAYRGDFTPRQHFGFEAAAWYWHFVDVVWLFLFLAIYIWGGWGAEYH
jgi:cytochrome c oxidase subunit 3